MSWQPPVHPSVDQTHPITEILGPTNMWSEAGAIALSALAKAGVEEPLRTALAADALADHFQATLNQWLSTTWCSSYPEHLAGRATYERHIQALRCLVSSRQQQLEARTRAAAA